MVRCCPEGLSSASSPHQIKDKRFELLDCFFFVCMSIFSGSCEPHHCVLLSTARWAESRINHSPSYAVLSWYHEASVSITSLVCSLGFSISWEGEKGLNSTRWNLRDLLKFVDGWLKRQPQLPISQWMCFKNAGISIKLLRFIYNIINVLKRNASASVFWWVKFAPSFGSWM